MKKILLLLPFLLLISCSVQKRKYQKGFQVSWKNHGLHTKEKQIAVAKQPAATKKQATSEITAAEPIVSGTPDLNVASSDKTQSVDLQKKRKPLIGDDPCDELIFRDGSEIKGKVVEITPTEIKYKKCDMLDGPSYVAKKSDVFMIKYANGTREVFKEQGAATNTQKKPNSNLPKTVHPMAIASLIFGILCLIPFLTSPIFAFLAWKFGNMALTRIAAQPDIYKGETMANVGRIMGKVIGIIWIVIACLILLALILGSGI